jgi:hypothetical protein
MSATSFAVKFMAGVARLRVVGVSFAENQPVWLCDANLHEILPQGCQPTYMSYIVEYVNRIKIIK